MKYLLLLLWLSPFVVLAEPVTIIFQPPNEYVDDTTLLDSQITEYRWDALLTPFSGSFKNTGNMTQFTADLPQDKYLICLYAKAGLWSGPRCTFINMFEPKPPLIC